MTAEQRLLSGRAWDDFCDQLKLAGRAIERFGDEPDAQDRAEFYRFLTRLVRNGCERFVENCEPNRPRLRDVPWRSTINFQSPDQDHLLCEFDEAREYRITGNRGSIPYFVMAAWNAPIPADHAARDWAGEGFAALADFDVTRLNTTGFLQSDAIDFDAEGDFEVWVGGTERARNWLPLTAESCGLLIRIVHLDRANERDPVMRIERVDGVSPTPIAPADVSGGLAKAGNEVLGYVELVRAWWQEQLADLPNRLRFSRNLYLSNGGVADRHHAFGTWQIADDQALVLTFTPPETETWIFQLCSMWQENLDCYEDGRGYVNKRNAHYEPDGSVRIVVSATRPALDGGNWVPTWGHVRGGMSLRLIKTATPPPVAVHLVQVEDLAREGWSYLSAAQALMTGEVTA